MGLCKCRNVTNLFCFEHRKNVCEKCILSDHPRCVVQSYLAWLQDSDYDALCKLCKQQLTGDVVRLTCFDLFHVDCINSHCAKLPEHTASAGYSCPSCHVPIIPPDNVNSQIAELVRNTFRDASWAQHIISKRVTPAPQDPRLEPSLNPINNSSSNSNSQLGGTSTSIQSNIASTSSISRLPTSPIVTNGIHMGGIPPKTPPGPRKSLTKFISTRSSKDVDDDKYSRKDSGGDWSSMLLSTFQSRLTTRRIIVLVVVALAVVILGRMAFAPSSGASKTSADDLDVDEAE
ncbi:hypothetical protein SmJEL517_g06171 [Synchytrium microbalum]|uniref:RING-type domain-containing protein n=1 Tax=Synchytrium microbalum TaxID=1806994 RepID=A0A507BQY6_9FUNG|nr:uncharacterized protein SmJEL517_g06171 [Synchytrium microbalum]TPX30212.1 hypothetical protein SmJEL517_g06171 [Synchytrium microbalum]